MANSGPDFTSRYTVHVQRGDLPAVEKIIAILGGRPLDIALSVEAPPVYQMAVDHDQDHFMRQLGAISGVEAVFNDSYRGDGTNPYDYAEGQFEGITDHFLKMNLAILQRCVLDFDYAFGPAILDASSIIFTMLRMEDEGGSHTEIAALVLHHVSMLLGSLLSMYDVHEGNLMGARAAFDALETNRPRKQASQE